MAFLLCHECFSWVEPKGGRCPECRNNVDSLIPDPPLNRLESIIGEIVSPIGEVKVDRKLLPDRGLLYATANGLYFLPHFVENEIQIVETTDAETSFLWWLATLAWGPLALIVPFLKGNGRPQERHVRVTHPKFLSIDQSHLLPQFLMQNPGVFFVPRKMVRVLGKRRNSWRIERVQGTTLKLKPLSDSRRFHEQMKKLIASGSWTEG